ncbi:DUF3024 domain-containing protein [Pseudactinotalea sp. Z1748]|uniref:DUF3024 domain-containing protein n=1 Tax=Pseudactinotalea sp. Z1748 TaxID=3413027 RepID=UPI003C79BB61
MRYTKSTGLWEVSWRDCDLKFHEYKPEPPTKNVQELLSHIDSDGRPDLLG